MRGRRLLQTAPYGVATAVVFLGLSALRADTLAYVRASSQYQRDKATEGFHVLNLLDDDRETIWCEGSDGTGEGEEIRFYFKSPQKIDRIVVTPTPLSGRRISRLRVSDGTNSANIDLDDATTVQVQPLKKSMEGTTFIVTITEVAEPLKGSKLPDTVACLADVLFYYKNKLFGGKMTPDKFSYDRQRDKILGRWSGEPLGAPERFLTFAIDGSWEWTFVPMLGGKSEKVNGEYRFRGDRLLMRRGETGRWADVNFKYKRVVADPNDIGAPLGDYDVVNLNDALGEKFAGEYNNAEF
jgi:hypothetical protein